LFIASFILTPIKTFFQIVYACNILQHSLPGPTVAEHWRMSCELKQFNELHLLGQHVLIEDNVFNFKIRITKKHRNTDYDRHNYTLSC